MCSVELIIILEIFTEWSNEWTSLVYRNKSNPIDARVAGKLLAERSLPFLHKMSSKEEPWISIENFIWVKVLSI